MSEQTLESFQIGVVGAVENSVGQFIQDQAAHFADTRV
jgi:hypothetical protein